MKTLDETWQSVGSLAATIVEGLRNKNARRAAGEQPGAQVPQRSGEEALDAAEEGRGRRRCDADATPIVSIIADNWNSTTVKTADAPAYLALADEPAPDLNAVIINQIAAFDLDPFADVPKEQQLKQPKHRRSPSSNSDSARFLRAGWQDAGKDCASAPASRPYDRATMRAGRPACIGDSVDSRAAMVILRPKSCARRR